MINMTMVWYGNLCGKKRKVRSYSIEVGTTAPCECCEDDECSAQAVWVDTIMGTKSSNAVLRAARTGWAHRHAAVVRRLLSRRSRAEILAVDARDWTAMRNYANAECVRMENRMKKILDMKNPYEED